MSLIGNYERVISLFLIISYMHKLKALIFNIKLPTLFTHIFYGLVMKKWLHASFIKLKNVHVFTFSYRGAIVLPFCTCNFNAFAVYVGTHVFECKNRNL